MHDWTLISLDLDWEGATIIVKLRDHTSSERKLFAYGVRGLAMRMDFPWGESASILSCSPVQDLGKGVHRVSLQIQSGDSIEIDAKKFEFPTIKRD